MRNRYRFLFECKDGTRIGVVFFAKSKIDAETKSAAWLNRNEIQPISQEVTELEDFLRLGPTEATRDS
jgi:hypothetical protein